MPNSFSLEDIIPIQNDKNSKLTLGVIGKDYNNIGAIALDPRITDALIQARLKKNNPKKYKDYQQRIASSLSAVGGIVSSLPHPVTKVIGTAMQTPDIILDSTEYINNPNSTDATHLVLDGGDLIKHIIPGNIDDIVFQTPGIVDDSYNAITGRDMIDNTRRSLSTPYIIYKEKIKNTKDKIATNTNNFVKDYNKGKIIVNNTINKKKNTNKLNKSNKKDDLNINK